mgnify:CR=1 FL=1
MIDELFGEKAMLRVLVIDDDPTTLALVSRVLQAHGHHVTTLAPTRTGDGDPPGEQVAWREFDAIILDLAMPGKAGDERMKEHVRRWSDSDKKRISVVLFSAMPARFMRQIANTLFDAGLENISILEKGRGLSGLIELVEQTIARE